MPVTYDLTSNTFSRVSISGWSDNITLLVNNADTADVPFFNGYGQNVKLVTAGSTLDLSHTTVSGFSVTSTNTLGTAFTVGDLGTAFQIAGGAGQDTITALGFIFTPDQRNTIFAIASVEKIVDQGGTYLKDATTADTFHGRSGNDIFNVDNAGDVVIEICANAGIDSGLNSPNSIAPSQILGRVSPSRGARKEQRLRPRESRSTRLPGAASNAASPKQPQRQSSALSGSSGRKMSWRAICDGQTTAARNGRARSRSNTTRPAPSSGIRSKNNRWRDREILMRMRRRSLRAAAPWRADDPERISRRHHQAVLIQRDAENRAHNARQDRPAFHLHARRLPHGGMTN